MKSLDKETLCEVGEALYGPLWQNPLAEALGVGDRTVRYWASGDRAVPAGVWQDIGALCRARADALQAWAARLPSKPKGQGE